MIRRIALSIPLPFPTLRFTDARSYLLTFLFVFLNVAVPRLFHQFQLTGATFLPMHFFVFIAGLTFGWRFGLVVGFLTPLASYAVSGLPAPAMLPQIIVEVFTYGLIAGVLREKFHLKPVWSLLGAMAAGRIALLLAVAFVYIRLGKVYSPIGLEASPLVAVWMTIKQGLPGIAIQLVSIPFIVWLITKLEIKSRVDNP
ncbi:MAG: ECF transporter S component [Chloroflexi bacterium]|nr:ECF transporter S component [Chloroflexota bacterium]